jgi:DNA-binding response OmpR family regulator
MAFTKAAAGNLPTVFVVEDDPDYRTILGEFLAEEGFSPVLFCTAQMLVSSLSCDLPAVIVTDVVMPGVSGSQLLATLRGNDRWKRVPVVVMTANNDTALPLRLDAPVVCKPDTDGLLREILSVLGRLPPSTLRDEDPQPPVSGSMDAATSLPTV